VTNFDNNADSLVSLVVANTYAYIRLFALYSMNSEDSVGYLNRRNKYTISIVTDQTLLKLIEILSIQISTFIMNTLIIPKIINYH